MTIVIARTPSKDEMHANKKAWVLAVFREIEEGVADYDILVSLLSPVLGGGAGRAAEALISRFGSFSEAIAAPPSSLSSLPSLDHRSVRTIVATRVAAARFARARIANKAPLIGSWRELLNYLHVQMAFENIEQFRILFLDKKNRLIADEVQQRGTVDHTPVYTREVIKRTLELSSTAIILCHNHPSGDPAPSATDVQMTRAILGAASPLGITVHDHIIIGKSGHASLRGLKLM